MTQANSVDYWADVFREQHVKNVDGIFELGRRFQECSDSAGDSTLGAASNRAGYKKSSVSQIRAVHAQADSRFSPAKHLLPLGWSILYDLSLLTDGEWQDALDADAIHPNITKAEARKLRRPEFDAPHDLEDLSGRAYEVVYADPPWRYEHVKTENRAIENQYPTMSLDEICELKVPSIIADDCVLFLWATSPKLAESMAVIDAWDFTYRTCMVWVKDKIGMGYYARQRHELLLIATRGQPGAPDEAARPDSVIEAPRSQHSAKPTEVYAMLEAMYPNKRRLELFCRLPQPNWSVWGNQANGM